MLTRLQFQKLYESDPDKLYALLSALEQSVLNAQDQIDELKAEIKALKDQIK